MDHPLRLPAELASAEPGCRHTCPAAGGARNYKGGVTRGIFSSLQDA